MLTLPYVVSIFAELSPETHTRQPELQTVRPLLSENGTAHDHANFTDTEVVRFCSVSTDGGLCQGRPKS